ncbi:MAG TPA: ATP phosphoribosyltransferase regulatory subunit, partial [Candidatus Norongarragalinales archaeon]|nr:ATP phosphoribosyltransferase regulatory subunit [Candidatus Norongarragalinales archaeon]
MTDLSPPRGSRDFLPQEKILRNSIVDTLRKTFEKYGFNPLETPALENFDVLSSKYAGGDEILKETYSLEDQGKRKLGLRYDLTVPLSRVFASQKLALPFKRYQIASVWRDGPIKAGRYREFTQCDVDVIGVASPKQEAELMALTRD